MEKITAEELFGKEYWESYKEMSHRQAKEAVEAELIVDVDGDCFISPEKSSDEEKIMAIRKGIAKAKEEGINLIYMYGGIPRCVIQDYNAYGLEIHKRRGEDEARPSSYIVL